MDRPTLAVIALLAALTLPLPAGAQAIYKYVRPDGRVIYSDKPVPGAKLVEEFEPPPPPDPANAARQKKDTEAGSQGLGRAADQRAKSLDQAWADLKLWTRRLEEAKANLEAGREPHEGERLGTAGRKARMSDAYWQRQQGNEAAVAEAEARVKQAQDNVNALR
ncbi:MAG: DUF4124 domain-containing protein [Burkholderiales bacterium]